MLTAQHKTDFDRDGYTLVRRLWPADQTAALRDHYMEVRAGKAYAGDLAATSQKPNDPLRQYPRLVHMHRWDDISLKWMLDPRLNQCLSALYDGVEPLAVQTMLYFKPPGGRGQAIHQDNMYLKARPGNCMAAWMALDKCDPANGCLRVVPGSHRWPLLCNTQANTDESFVDVTVPIPPGTPLVDVIMEPGDVLFFDGTLVHGSLPNTTTDRFRRALIGHYISGHAREVAAFYHPVLRMDGSVWKLDQSPGGGPCGVWVDKVGRPEIELTGSFGAKGPAHE